MCRNFVSRKVQHSLILFTPTHTHWYTHTHPYTLWQIEDTTECKQQTKKQSCKFGWIIHPNESTPPPSFGKILSKIFPHRIGKSPAYPAPSPRLLLSIFRIDFPPKTNATRKQWGIRLTFRLEFGLEGTFQFQFQFPFQFQSTKANYHRFKLITVFWPANSESHKLLLE